MAQKELGNGDLVSSSFDKTIKIWSGDLCIKTLVGYTNTVSCLDVMDNGDLVSWRQNYNSMALVLNSIFYNKKKDKY